MVAASAMIRLVVGAYAAQAICVAARLGVADVLATGPQPVDVIARRVGAHESALYRLLRALGDVDVVAELDDRSFALTPLGEILRSDVPGSLRAWATLIGMPFWHRSWSELYDGVRTGEVPFDRVNGADFFSYLAENPDDANTFESGFSAMYTYRNIFGTYDLRRFNTIVDVDADSGDVLADILSANPHLRGVPFDAPAAEGDVYLLSGMLHGASDDEAVKILGACRAAMPSTACLLIAETVLPDGGRPSVGKLMDLQMLVFTADGRFRTESEFRTLLDQAGFRVVRIVPSSDMVSLVEAVPVGS